MTGSVLSKNDFLNGRNLQENRYSRLVKAIDLSENVVGLLSDPSKRRYVHGSSKGHLIRATF